MEKEIKQPTNKTNTKARFFAAKFLYSVCCNIPVCLALTFTSCIINVTSLDNLVFTVNLNNFNWLSFATNLVLAFILAMIVSLCVPITLIGRWFTALFKVKNDTYEGNMKYRLLATFIASIIFYLAITPTLGLINYFVFEQTDFLKFIVLLIINMPLMLIVGFVSTLINDVFAYKVARAIDNNF